MALSEKDIKRLENINVKNFDEEYIEELRDEFEVISYLLSQIDSVKGTMAQA